MTEMNIAFCINNSYADKVAVVMTSVLENHPDEQLNFYVFSSDLTEKSLQLLQKLQSKYKNFTLQHIVVPRNRVKSLPLPVEYIPAEAYYRYFIADLLPALDKVLYLDADLIVCKNITDFYNTDLGDCYLAGAEGLYATETGHKQHIGLDNKDIYINSGVLLMNLKQFRQNNLSKKLISTTKKLHSIIKYADQDIINIVCHNKIKLVNSIYNFTQHNILREKDKINSACIIHYTGCKKPWGKQAKKVPLADVWKKYAQITDSIVLSPTIYKIKKCLLKIFNI